MNNKTWCIGNLLCLDIFVKYIVFTSIGATNFSFASSFLSLDDPESLVVYSYSESSLDFFLVLLNHYTLEGLVFLQTCSSTTGLQRFDMFQSLYLQYLLLKVLYRSPVQVWKTFLLTTHNQD